MKYLCIGLIYFSFFGCIAVACWVTVSAWPLIGLVFCPTYKSKDGK